jgi:hypothetical protein
MISASKSHGHIGFVNRCNGCRCETETKLENIKLLSKAEIMELSKLCATDRIIMKKKMVAFQKMGKNLLLIQLY